MTDIKKARLAEQDGLLYFNCLFWVSALWHWLSQVVFEALP